MELHQLRYFLAAAETGSISRAADRCHVAQPSLSHQVKKLERTLGVRLFDRLGRGVADRHRNPAGRGSVVQAGVDGTQSVRQQFGAHDVGRHHETRVRIRRNSY